MRKNSLVLLGLIFSALLLALPRSAVWAATSPYPAVLPMQRTFNVPDVATMNTSLVIHSDKGGPLYRLRCAHPGNAQNYSGAFECRLDTVKSGDVKVNNTLLREDVRQLRPWPSRGRFFAPDLIGKCAAIPQFGATRTFRLRSMQLTLQVLSPRVVPSDQGAGGSRSLKLKSMKLRITVHPAPAATRVIAAVVPFPKHRPPQCGINPGGWVVGALGNVMGYPLKDISYFGNPATFTRGQPPAKIDWSSVPFSKPDWWNHGIQVGGTVKHCSAHFRTPATFRGMLLARRFHIADRRSRVKSKTTTMKAILLKLDHPITICRQVAPNLATKEAAAMAGTGVSATFLSAARKEANKAKGITTRHVTTLGVSHINLLQVGGYNQHFVGHRVEIWGSVVVGSLMGSSGKKYDQPSIMNIEKICLVNNGNTTHCLSGKRAL